MNKNVGYIVGGLAVVFGLEYLLTRNHEGKNQEKEKQRKSLYLLSKYPYSDRIEFGNEVIAIAQRLGTNPDYLMAVIHFETAGTFNPGIKNPNSSATGLIQFMASTAQDLGTTTTKLRKMTALQQLFYVEKYLKPYQGKMTSFLKTYLAVFYPKSIPWSMDKNYPGWVVRANPIFKENGIVTKRTILKELKRRYSGIAGGRSIAGAGTTTGYFPPYTQEPFGATAGKTDRRLRAAKGKSGVYIIRENKNVVYVGHSKSDLYKIILRHFQRWNDPTQYRVTYSDELWSNNYDVKIIYTTPAQAEKTECNLIDRYDPRDNIKTCFDNSDVPF